jgi:YbgC/YbaW family acyl-CoA thioester hydrolase
MGSMINVPTEECIRVRYGETDQMGHAYYSNYLLWYEQARGAWCRDRGFTYKSLEDQGFKLPVVEVWSRYKGEVKYDDDIVVRVKLAEVKRAAIKFEYEVHNLTTGAASRERPTGGPRPPPARPLALRPARITAGFAPALAQFE